MASSSYQIWLLFGLYGIYFGISKGIGKALVADFVLLLERGTAYGLYSDAVGILALPASVLAGVLWQGAGDWQGIGLGAPFLVGAIMTLIAALVLSTVKGNRPGMLTELAS